MACASVSRSCVLLSGRDCLVSRMTGSIIFVFSLHMSVGRHMHCRASLSVVPDSAAVLWPSSCGDHLPTRASWIPAVVLPCASHVDVFSLDHLFFSGAALLLAGSPTHNWMPRLHCCRGHCPPAYSSTIWPAAATGVLHLTYAFSTAACCVVVVFFPNRAFHFFFLSLGVLLCLLRSSVTTHTRMAPCCVTAT